MEHVSIALHTPLAGFANDLCDVLKLFFAVDGYWVNQDAPGSSQ